jgi:hypothetical protein
MPLALTSEQLAQVMTIAGPIPPGLRSDYLAFVAQLSGRDLGDGDVHRACREAAKQVIWNVTRRPV